MTDKFIVEKEWRISKSGYSIGTGWSDEKKIIASMPADTGAAINAWIEAADKICEAHNAELTQANATIAELTKQLAEEKEANLVVLKLKLTAIHELERQLAERDEEKDSLISQQQMRIDALENQLAERDAVIKKAMEQEPIAYIVQDTKTLRPVIAFAKETNLYYDNIITVKQPVPIYLLPPTPAIPEGMQLDVSAIMEQAQVFASAWAIFGSGSAFEPDNAQEIAEEQRAKLKAMLSASPKG